LKAPHRKHRLYLITNRRAFLHSNDQFQAIELAARAGCPLIQIREKDLSARELKEFTLRAVAAARPFGAKTLVNDRLDVALAAGADGVHLPVASLSVADARAIADQNGKQEFLIAASTHSEAEVRRAASQGVDFVVYGPIFDTPSKREYGAPLGVESLSKLCAEIETPILGLGGVTLENYQEVLQTGAAGVAAIGLFSRLDRIEESIRIIFSA
jgi:thiamine-phosphate pyrophosphorylase